MIGGFFEFEMELSHARRIYPHHLPPLQPPPARRPDRRPALVRRSRFRPIDGPEALLAHAGGAESETLISESGLYKAFYRYQHPENRHLRRWLTQEVIPTLRDQVATAAWKPRRAFLSWEGARVSLLEWQGEWWVPLEQLPHFSRQVEEPARRGWLRR